MNITPCREDYDYPKFILYLYLCAAYADYKIDDEEIDLIRQKMKKYNLIGEEEFERCWHKVLNDFRQHNDMESMQHIEACCRQLKIDQEARQKIYRDFNEIIHVDGEEDQSEEMFMFRFKKILGIYMEKKEDQPLSE